MQRTLELSFDRLVIGSDLSAFAYSYVHRCPAIYLRVLAPYKYNRYGTYDSDKRLWDEMAYALTLDNLLPLSDKATSLRIEEGNILKVVTKQSVVCNIKYNQLIISDDYMLEGIPAPNGKTDNKNWIIDWFAISRSGPHNYSELFDFENEFVKKIVFYVSERNPYRPTKDCVALSVLTDEELASGEYDQNLARLKTRKTLRSLGLGNWNVTSGYMIIPRLTSLKRDVYPLGKNTYDNLPPNVSMLYDSADAILKLPRTHDNWKRYGINR